jgi:hypothetical protein
MSDTASIDKIEESAVERTFEDFLEFHPPNQLTRISKVEQWHSDQKTTRNYQGIATPDIRLHCPHEACNGVRYFRCISKPASLIRGEFVNDFLTYLCWNCQRTKKVFSLSVCWAKDTSFSGDAIKFGEDPPFGPPTPARLIKLIGPDREIFLKGRRCENQGLGIGAFVYYRRVVENQKVRILKEIGKVATKVGARPEAIKLLEEAEKEVQFTKAMEIAKSGLPESLLIDAHNPLGLLHTALSEGVHELTDEECLKSAESIRVVLCELSDRIAQVLKDESELKNALATLMNRKNRVAPGFAES